MGFQEEIVLVDFIARMTLKRPWIVQLKQHRAIKLLNSIGKTYFIYIAIS